VECCGPVGSDIATITAFSSVYVNSKAIALSFGANRFTRGYPKSVLNDHRVAAS
jgi:hypothetical protein